MNNKYSKIVTLFVLLFGFLLLQSSNLQAKTLKPHTDFSQTIHTANDLLTSPQNFSSLTSSSARQSRDLLKTKPAISNFTALTAPVSGVAGTCPWTLDVDGTLTVGAGTLDTYGYYRDVNTNFTYEGESWLEHNSNIKKVVLQPGVQLPTNCAYVFANLIYCTEIDGLDKLDTSQVTNMASMFYRCSKLSELDLSNFDVSHVTDMSYMFDYVATGNILNVNLSGWKTSQLKNTSGMFIGDDLTDFNFQNIDTSNVTSMDYMFNSVTCTGTLDLRSLDTSNVTTMSNMFGYSQISAADLKGFDTSKVTDMSYMFRNSEFQKLDLSNWDTSQVYNLAAMFDECQQLTKLNVGGKFGTFSSSQSVITNSDLDGSSLFLGCSKLINLNLTTWRTENVISMKSWFKDCSDLQSITWNKKWFNTSNVTVMSFMFYGCSSLLRLDVSGFETSNVTSMPSMFYGCSSLPSLDVSDFETSNVTSMSSMFYGCSSLPSLDVSDFDTRNVTDMSSMFSVCSSLPSLDVSDFDTSNVKSMSSMFYGCSSLPSLDVSKFDTSNVKDISSMFSGCSSLPSLDLSNFDTRKVTDMSHIFYACENLTNLDLSSFDTSQVTDMSDMFYNCRSLPSLDLSNFDTSQVIRMFYMFYNCSSLTHLDVSNFNTSKVVDMESMFSGCSNLTSLDLSKFDTTKVQYKESILYFTQGDHNLWKIKVSSKVLFPNAYHYSSSSKYDWYNDYVDMPQLGLTFQDGAYQYKVLGQAGQKTGAWQAVGAGTDHHPTGTIYPTRDSLDDDFLRNANRPSQDQDSDASKGNPTQTLVWQHQLKNQTPQVRFGTLGTTNMDLEYCHDYQDKSLPAIQLSGSVIDNDSSQVQLYYAIDPVDITPTLAEIENYQKLQLTPLIIQDPSLAQSWTANIIDQTDLKTLATPKAGGHQIKIYAVDSGGQFTNENPQASTAATVNVAENSIVQLNYLDNNTNQPIFNTDENGTKPAKTVVGVVGKPIDPTDQANFPTAIKTKHYRYTLTNALEIPPVFPAITTDPLLPLTPYQLDLKYNSGTMNLIVPDTLDFGTKIVQTAKQAYDLPYDATRTALKVTDTTGAPSWQLSLAIADFTSDQTTTPLTDIFQYLPAGSSTPTAISQTPAVIDQYDKHHTLVDGSGKAVTDISTGWWDTSHHQIAGPKLDLRQLQVPVYKADYHATATWSLVNSLQ